MAPDTKVQPEQRSRARRARMPIFCLLLLCLFVVTCVPDPISDLAVVGVQRIPQGAVPMADYAPPERLRGDQAVWKVSLTGESRWVREVRRHELNGYAEVLRCDDRDKSLFSEGPYVGTVLVSYYGKNFERFEPPGRPTLRYDVYIPAKRRYHSESDFNAPMPSYDLDREQMELCIRLGGGSMAFAYATSNEVRVVVGTRRVE